MGKADEKSVFQRIGQSIYRRESEVLGNLRAETTTVLGGVYERTTYTPIKPAALGGSTERGRSESATSPSTSSPVAGGAGGTGGTTGGSGGGSGKRKIPCPNCTGVSYNDKNGRKTSGIVSLLARIGGSIINPLLEIIQFILDLLPIPHIDVLKGKCGACGGSQEIEDPSDITAESEATRANLQAAEPDIQKDEAKLGMFCGNDIEVIAGSKHIKCGLGGPPTTQPYAVHKDKGVRVKGVVCKEKGCAPEGGTCNHVQGFPVVASPGGHFTIECDNSFGIITGPQGFDLTTKGPVTLNGGITRIVGPEVSVGSSQGKLSLEGDVVTIGARSVEIAPTDGDLVVKGKISATGNMVIKGKLHAESLSFGSATAVGKNEQSNVSAPTNRIGGQAKWGGWNTQAIEAVLLEIKSFVTKTIANNKIAQLAVSFRYLEAFNDNILNTSYTLQGIEFKVTGICFTLGIPGIVINFPHVHALPDGMHVHETKVPDIDLQEDNRVVRSMADASGINTPAPVMTQKKSFIDTILGLIQSFFALLGFGEKSPYFDNG